MDADFWHTRWREGRLGFHEDVVNPRLSDNWEALGVEPGAPVLVPLCGKSLDLGWLADRGHPVLGVELSGLAVRAWFAERGVEPDVVDAPPFRRWTSGAVTLLEGDVFDLPPEDVAACRGAYDRGALVALPEPTREAYARHLGAILPPGARCLLVTLEYDTARMSGPPFSLADEQVRGLFEDAFEVRKLAEDAGPHVVGRLAGRGLETLREVVWALRARRPSDRTERSARVPGRGEP